MRTGVMTSLDDVKARLKARGSFFFSPDTMRAFNSRVSSNVYSTDQGTYFVTSEKDHGVYISSGYVPPAYDGRRTYTVRFIDLEGTLHKASEFSQYASYSGAHKAAARMQKTGFPTCEFMSGKCSHDLSEEENS